MPLVVFVIALALMEYMFFGIQTARARAKAGIVAPATSGDPTFERTFRVQQNTLEQLIIFVPAMLMTGFYVHELLAVALGLVFIAGRFIYYQGYVSDPGKRGTGFLVGEVAQSLLLLIGAVGALLAWL